MAHWISVIYVMYFIKIVKSTFTCDTRFAVGWFKIKSLCFINKQLENRKHFSFIIA